MLTSDLALIQRFRLVERLQLGAWCWIGSDNKLRAHEGNLRLGPKVVMGRGVKGR